MFPVRKYEAGRKSLMRCTSPAKTVEIGGHAFTIAGERTADGSLRFTVLDIDCALPEPDDEIARQFKEALKRRIGKLRREREAASATPGSTTTTSA